jgi:hypothetical protein
MKKRHHRERQEERDRQEQPLRAGEIGRDPTPGRREQPGKRPVSKKANRRPESECPGKQERALGENVHDDVARERIDDHQQARQPRRALAKQLDGEQVRRDDEQNRARERQPERGCLPRGRAFAAQKPVHRRDQKRMERMVGALQSSIAPRAGFDPFGLMNVAQTVGEAGFRVAGLPQEHCRGDRHEQPCSRTMPDHGPAPQSLCESLNRGQGSCPSSVNAVLIEGRGFTG